MTFLIKMCGGSHLILNEFLCKMYDEKTEIIYPEENEHRLTDELFWKINLLLRFRGFEDHRKIIWLIAVLLKGAIVVSITTLAYKVKHEPNKLAACVATCPAIFMAVLKLLYMHFQSKRVKYLLDTVHEEFWDLGIAGDRLKKRLTRRFILINMLLANQMVFSLGCVYFLNMYPLMETPEGDRRLPNAIWTPFDTNFSPLYEILYVFLLWNQVFTILGNGFYDFTYACAVQHLCAQLVLLKELLKNLTVGIMPDASDLERYSSKYFQDKVMERLKICVRHHCKLLKYGKHLDKYTSTILIPQLIMSYLAMVVNGYILTTNGAGFLQSIELQSFTMLMFSEFVVFAIQASDLKDQSISVVKAVTLSEWYLFRAPIKKALIFLMLNAEKGIVITVGGMIEVDNSLIIAILHKVFSAITLLKALIDEAEQSKQ